MGGDILGPVGAVDDPAGLHELGVGARAGDAVGQGEPGEGPLLHALDQNGDGQIGPEREVEVASSAPFRPSARSAHS
jgi:hypothetical protein